ncbi:unnamed protein product, partial [Dicrocoelium dendriticum]
EERIRNGSKKLLKAKNTSTQGRIDNFFTALPAKPSDDSKSKPSSKNLTNSTQDKKRKSTGGSAASLKKRR